MYPRPAACAAWVVGCAIAMSSRSFAAETLSLQQAFARVTEAHPGLQVSESRRESLRAQRDRAALAPPLRVGAALENAAGTGDASSVDAAELTLSLASVLERGGKRTARTTVIDREIDALSLDREAVRLDLMAEVARRYIAIVAAERRRAIASIDAVNRQRARLAARQQRAAGAAPESQRLAAEAALVRSGLDARRAEAEISAARSSLAAMWGEESPGFTIEPADPMDLPPVPDLLVLTELLARSPEIARFAGEARIREARLQLARSDASFDIDWQVGMRRLEASDDFALVAGVSIPLDVRRRSSAGVRVASAELAAVEIAREAGLASLHATLAQAHGRLRTTTLEARILGAELIPTLEQAAAAAERAWHAGAAGYLEWAQLLTETSGARHQQLDAAIGARLALIEIQRLTGSPFVTESIDQTASGATP